MELKTLSDNLIFGSTSSSNPPMTSYTPTISKIVSADLPALVEAELLSFAGTDATDALARQLHPFRADLVRARIPARRWPDFAPTVRRREKSLSDEQVMMIKAGVILSSGDEHGQESQRNVAVGMAWLGFSKLETSIDVPQKSPIRMAANLTKAHLYQALDKLETILWPDSNAEADGTDHAFLHVFKAEVVRSRKEVERKVLNGRPYVTLELIYVHPAHRGAGAGAALLSHCIALSESASASTNSPCLPLLLESTLVATPLYIRFGFREVYHSRVEYGGETYEWPVLLREPTSRS